MWLNNDTYRGMQAEQFKQDAPDPFKPLKDAQEWATQAAASWQPAKWAEDARAFVERNTMTAAQTGEQTGADVGAFLGKAGQTLESVNQAVEPYNLPLQIARRTEGYEQLGREDPEREKRIAQLREQLARGDESVLSELNALSKARKSEPYEEAAKRSPDYERLTNTVQLGEGAIAMGIAPTLASGAVRNIAAGAIDPVGQALGGGLEAAGRGIAAINRGEVGAIRLPEGGVKLGKRLSDATDPANRTLGEMYITGQKDVEPSGLGSRWDQSWRAVVRASFDRQVDLNQMQRLAEKVKKTPLADDELVAFQRRLNPNVAAEQRIDEGLRPALDTVRNIQDGRTWLSTYLTHLHDIDVAQAMGVKAEQAVLERPLGTIEGTAAARRKEARAGALERLEEQDAIAAAELLAEGKPKPPRSKVQQARDAAERAKQKLEANTQAAERARVMEAAAKGSSVEAERLFSGGRKKADAERALASMEQDLGPEVMVRIQQAAQQVWDFNRDILDRMLDAGLVTQDEFMEWTQRYPHYVKTVILDYADDPDIVTKGSRIGVWDRQIKALSEQGTVRAREDPIASSIRNAQRAEALIQRNRTFNALLKTRDILANSPDAKARAVGELIRDVGDDFTKTNTEVKLSGWVEGEQKSVAVSNAIRNAVIDEEKQVIPLLSAANSLIAGLWTRFSPLFLPTNAVMDAFTYAVRASSREGGPQHLPRVMAELGKAYVDVFRGLTTGTYSGRTAALRREGGGMFGFYSHTPAEGQRALDRLGRERIWDVSGPDGVKALLTDILKMKPVSAVGERIEMAPRVAQKTLAERRGMSNLRGTVQGRDVTIDFQQGGNMAKVINQFIPFFNVGLQAGAQIARAAKENPRGFMSSVITLLGGPVVAAEAWNRADPQRARDYDDVPDYIKDQGVVIMWPGEAPVDEQGNRRPQFILLRMRDYAPFVITAREAVSRALGDDPRSYADLIGNGLMAISPVQGSNPADVLFSAVGPLPSTALELATDKDVFRGTQITSERADEQASALSKTAAAITGARPSQVEFAARNVTGGIGQMALGASNIAAGRPQESAGPGSIPVVGGLAGRIVKGNIGGRLEKAREDRVSPQVQGILQQHGIRDVAPTTSTVVGMKLNVAEMERYQTLVNQYLNQYILEMVNYAGFQGIAPENRKKVLENVITSAREMARSDIIQGMSPEDIVERRKAAGY